MNETSDSTPPQQLAALREAFTTQDLLNRQIDPQWAEQNWDFSTAVNTELAELVEHLNWKWWKGKNYQEPPTAAALQQIHLELVDVFHFYLSGFMQAFLLNPKETRAKEIALLSICLSFVRHFNAEPCRIPAVNPIVKAVNEFQDSSTDISKFAILCATCGLTMDRLLFLYFAKKSLNEFRWANGYKEGTYQKMWRTTISGALEEDNAVLMRLLDGCVAECGGGMKMVLDGSMARYLSYNLAHEYHLSFPDG